MFGEVAGRDEGQGMCLRPVEARIVEGLGSGVLNGPVHPLSLAVGPRMIRPGQTLLDRLRFADAIEDMPAEQGDDLWMTAAVLGQVSEGHAVVGEHGVDRAGEGPSTTWRRNAAPSALPVLSWNVTTVNFDTRSMARNMTSLPWAWRSLQLSMWTKPIVVSAKLPRLEAFSSLAGSLEMP